MAHDELREKWREQTAPHERLRWARTYWQARSGAVNGTATDAAHSLGMKPGTYAGYERAPGSSKNIEMSHQKAIPFGRRFQVDWTWLLTGEGTPFDNQLPEPQARVVEALAKAPDDQQAALAPLIEQMIETFVRRAG